ncbi:MAG TPA: flagellar basal body rod C-terminal domain-containing protein [Gemmatimonadales bacterium]|nr:flagellar basal body rod C-terminal domain-containing protein [Gemmatimonadales bacterium]
MAIGSTDPATGQPVTTVVTDQSPGRLVYDPSHPDANDDGYVQYPNVDLATETVDLMIARRMHDANVSVFQAAKAMLRRALDL